MNKKRIRLAIKRLENTCKAIRKGGYSNEAVEDIETLVRFVKLTSFCNPISSRVAKRRDGQYVLPGEGM